MKCKKVHKVISAKGPKYKALQTTKPKNKEQKHNKQKTEKTRNEKQKKKDNSPVDYLFGDKKVNHDL